MILLKMPGTIARCRRRAAPLHSWLQVTVSDYDPHRDDAITSAYDTNAEYWTRIVRAGLDRYQQELTDPAILAAVGDCSHQVVVDAGCGEGSFTMTLARQGVAAIYGIDTCLPLIAAARQLVGQDDRSVTFRHGDVDNIDLPDDTVDVVVCNRIPHALTDPGSRFYEFARVLRPGGRLVALSQHPCFYSNRQNRKVSADEYFRGKELSTRRNSGRVKLSIHQGSFHCWSVGWGSLILVMTNPASVTIEAYCPAEQGCRYTPTHGVDLSLVDTALIQSMCRLSGDDSGNRFLDWCPMACLSEYKTGGPRDGGPVTKNMYDRYFTWIACHHA